MHNNAQKQFHEKVEEIIMFAATVAGLVFMLLYWR